MLVRGGKEWCRAGKVSLQAGSGYWLKERTNVIVQRHVESKSSPRTTGEVSFATKYKFPRRWRGISKNVAMMLTFPQYVLPKKKEGYR